MTADRLFRPQAVAARRTDAHGAILIVQPLSLALLSAAAVAIAAAVVAFLVWGRHTQHTTLRGRLVPDGGIVKVHAPQAGTIVERHASEGRPVERGETLYVISSERLSSALGATHALVARDLERRQRSLKMQIAQTRALERAERDSIRRLVAAWREEQSDLDDMLASQRERLALAEAAASRYARMRASGFVADDDVDARRANAVEQRARLQSVKREHAQVERRLAEALARLERLPLQYANERAELERALAATGQERAENEARRRVAVTAPTAGVLTAVVGELGQAAEPRRPLASIVPSDARLHAELFAPSRAIGFVEAGDAALLRYAAYPYQKFGHHRATIVSVSRVAAPAHELAADTAATAEAQGEPIYRIEARLPAQTLDAYGRPRPLQAGMTVEADVPRETRRIYEWILEPLHTLGGNAH